MHTRRFVAVVGASLVLAQGVGCDDADEAPSAASSSTGSGGSAQSSGGSGGSSGSGGTRGNEGGTAGAAGAPATTETSSGGTAGAAGSTAGDDWPQTCDEIPHEDPGAGCEPVLRAIVTSRETAWPLLTFEYDSAGRLVTVGDERDHSDYFVHRYTYDDAGRVTRFEDDCAFPRTTQSCRASYEFTYAEAGWLQTVARTFGSGSASCQETYDEDGSLLEYLEVNSSGATGSTYQYRSDRQIDTREYFSVDDSGTRVLELTATYDYGDDDLVDAIDCVDSENYVDFSCHESFGYTLEEGRVRTRHRGWNEGDYDQLIVFDDLGFPAFEQMTLQGDDKQLTVVLDGTRSHAVWEAKPSSRCLGLPIDASSRYRPYAFADGVIESFSYTLHDTPLSRRVTLADDGMLAELTATWGPGTDLKLESLRCGGVVFESVRKTDPYGTDASATYYYYGCDDFVLPSPLPEL